MRLLKMYCRQTAALTGAACVLLPFSAQAKPDVQRPFSECVAKPEEYLALGYRDFDQGVKADPHGAERREWGWREVAARPGCETATAYLIAMWRTQHATEIDVNTREFLKFHEGQIRASAGDYAGAIPLIMSGYNRTPVQPEWTAYVDAILAFLKSDEPGLLAARDRLLKVPEPANWPKLQQLFREQAGQEMRWPMNIEATDMLLSCFGKGYPGGVNGSC